MSRKTAAAKRAVLPSNLAWQRSINVSEGEMFAVLGGGEEETRAPVEVKEITIRGAIASYNAGYAAGGKPLSGDALEKAQNPAKPNVQTIQFAALPSSSDTLALRFALAFSGANASPDACNEPAYRAALAEFAAAAYAARLHEELAARYLWNIANGRPLWRNAFGTDRRAAVAAAETGAAVRFDCASLPTDAFPGVGALAAAADKPEAARALVAKVAGALAGGPLARLNVELRVRLYPGAEVWPSQEFATRDAKRRDDGGEVSRVLSSKPAVAGGREIRHATMHSQKIGNAIRTVDEWHGVADYGAIAVEAFGWVQRDQAAIRKPAVNDAYTVLRDIGDIAAALPDGEAGVKDRALYALAIMVRGGVYPMKGDEDKRDAVPVAPDAVAAPA